MNTNHLWFSLMQVEPTASSLNTNDVFVLKSPDSLVLWKGKGSTPDEVAAGQYVASLLGGTFAEVEESKETGASWKSISKWSLNLLSRSLSSVVLSWCSAGFWTALGGKKDYQTSKNLQATVKPPRLFACSNKTGRLIVSL